MRVSKAGHPPHDRKVFKVLAFSFIESSRFGLEQAMGKMSRISDG